MLSQNDLEYLQDAINLGKLTADEANVEKIRMQRVLIVKNSLPKHLRIVLNKAVEDGTLGHMKKEGRKPEVYYHPNFKHLATQERSKHEQEILNVLKSVCK